MTDTLITIVAPAHGEKRHECSIVDSMLNQKNPNWKLIVYHNGINEQMREWITGIDKRIVYKESLTDTAKWGTVNREHAVRHIVDTKYVINSSVQDIYLPNAIEEISAICEQDVDLVHWQAINHLFRYNILNGEIAWGHIDWGQWVVKTDYIAKTGVVQKENFSSDWLTLQALLQGGDIKKAHKIEKILTIHQ